MRNNFRPSGWRGISLLPVLLAIPFGVCAQSNIVYNGSFETAPVPSTGWESGGAGIGGHVNETGAADGRNWLDLFTGADLWQDLTTVAGRSYIIRFAISTANKDLRVLWDGAVVGEVNFTNFPWQPWFYTNFVGTATSATSRVEFQVVSGGSSLDAVSVGWRDEPPTIITQVPSRSSFEGGTVTFPVVVSGGPPLAYQWYFNDVPMNGATNRILTITNVQPPLAGNYTVIVTNPAGQCSSLPASLVTQPIPHLPLIVDQPKASQTTAGYFAGFYVFAVGDPTLTYQWRFNGTNDIPGATDAHYSIPSVALSNAGDYSVLVSNAVGTTLSIPAHLSVVTGYGGGVVVGDNYSPPDVDSPIFDVDGVTPLAGAGYSAQLYAGATSNVLHAVGASATFSPDMPGYYFMNDAVPIPDVTAGKIAYVQVRAWDNHFGSTFEEAQALGGRFGQSDIFTVVLNGPPPSPTPVSGLWSFSLQAGQPLLATAKLYPGGTTSDGTRQWLLVGDVGAQYVIERRAPPNDWSPLLLVTNVTGTVTFTDTNAVNSSVNFYRARIVEP